MAYEVHGYWWVTFEGMTHGPFRSKNDASQHLWYLWKDKK